MLPEAATCSHILMMPQIREHYLKYNGGYPERSVFCSKEDKKQYVINYFFQLDAEKVLQ